jgi:hypothetical protein
MSFINLKAGLAGLSLLFASSVSATESKSVTVDVLLQLGQKTTAVISCHRIANKENPNWQTLSTLDSALHGYEGDLYTNKPLREQVLQKILEKQPSETARIMARRAFTDTYQPFDDAKTDQERMDYLGRKLIGHGVKVGDILRQCTAPAP